MIMTELDTSIIRARADTAEQIRHIINQLDLRRFGWQGAALAMYREMRADLDECRMLCLCGHPEAARKKWQSAHSRFKELQTHAENSSFATEKADAVRLAGFAGTFDARSSPSDWI